MEICQQNITNWENGKKVAICDEFANIGGNCTHRGTIPSKALRHATQIIESREEFNNVNYQDLLSGAESVIKSQMELRRGFEVAKGEKIIICEDIITTGGSALKAAQAIEALGGKVVAFASLANRGFCKRVGGNDTAKAECSLPHDIPLFSLDDFTFEMYSPEECPMCKEGSIAIKPGSKS